MTDQLEMMPDEGKQDSPRLAWMKKMLNEIGVEVSQDEDDGEWCACVYCGGYGDTKEDAIIELAEKLGIPLWNEEEFAGGGK